MVIENDRLVSAHVVSAPEEVRQDHALRPIKMADYIGQPHVHEQMEVFIAAARKRKRQV